MNESQAKLVLKKTKYAIQSKRYRDKLKKENPQKYIQMQENSAARRQRRLLRKKTTMDKKQIEELIAKWRENCKKFHELPSDIQNLNKSCAVGTVAPVRTKPGRDEISFVDSKSDRKQNGLIKGRREIVLLKESKNDLDKSRVTKPLETDKTPSEMPVITEVKIESHDPGQQHCRLCNGIISGFVFVCVQCETRECGACDARGRHARHYVLRAPAGSAESELELVLSKVHETLSSIRLLPRTDSPSRVPDIDKETETEFEIIKMEIKAEEEEYQRPTKDPLSTPAESQPLPWDAYAVAEGSTYLPPRDDEGSDTSSVTLTASNPSDPSASDSEELDSLAPSNIKRKLIWTDRMDQHLIRSYILATKAERRRSRVYARLKQAFTAVFPHNKFTRSQLEEQRKIICRKRLVSQTDILNISYEIPYTKFPKGSIVHPKGLRLPLTKVTSHVKNKASEAQDLPIDQNPEVNVDNPKKKHLQVNNRKKNRMNKYKTMPLKPPEAEILPPARSGRPRWVPVRLLS